MLMAPEPVTGQIQLAVTFNRDPVPSIDTDLRDGIVTPHVAGHGYGYMSRCAQLAVENVERLENDEPRLYLVDRDLNY